ncbi:alpha/beta hydrolase [Flammeovirga kamogawensis]|uniref:Alpha/beta hydrolase n=1 Tax=Flammeovirga kamogawensis TaxID=373891 RepID=A0ABX8H270_9BACT|nr:alpha/beta hydrolase [Flammeovirga kamogawensis]MBB6462379.1 acetyl esterase/lipase [Flammeovirga kamogawensis]QWG09492.1 alpha/beta hydrolase [Flammeovirga kamogawensis]TRX65008.1 alpha/beta hydrolase [Flammeovirga kamogawensis]
MKRIILTSFIIFLALQLFAQVKPTEKVVYKEIGDVKLKHHIFIPKEQDKSRGAVVLIHGGGWNSGSPKAFYLQAQHLADRGLVVFSPEYRLRKKHGTTIYECVEDTQEAIAFVRKNAEKYGIDPNKIAVGGGSAGGHLALSAAFIDPLTNKLNQKDYAPNLLVLFNPVLGTSKEGYGHRKVAEELSAKGINWETFSPRQNIDASFPPMLIQLGDHDKVTSIPLANDFESRCVGANVNCKLMIYKGAEHSFFNLGYGKKQGYPKGTVVNRWYYDTLQEMDNFFVENNYLSTPFTVEIPADAIYPIRKEHE